MDKPDKIWVESCDDEWDSGVWGQSWENDTDVKYLLATPERELASELVEATKELRRAQKAYMMNRGVDRLGQIVGEAAKAVDAVLAKLDKGE